ncbi:unnamed protein product [Rangifer tarandus platyrhynchus]|uniref:Uncharacterized protein n=1 Tax=Rangifer tarandus platyrhynchus TaxID=3082113 RepID=A0AC59YAH8_RANTA
MVERRANRRGADLLRGFSYQAVRTMLWELLSNRSGDPSLETGTSGLLEIVDLLPHWPLAKDLEDHGGARPPRKRGGRKWMLPRPGKPRSGKGGVSGPSEASARGAFSGPFQPSPHGFSPPGAHAARPADFFGFRFRSAPLLFSAFSPSFLFLNFSPPLPLLSLEPASA